MSDWSTSNISNPKKKRLSSMMAKMQKYVASWTQIQTYIVPTRGQFNNSQPTYGKMIDHKTLIDSYATHANRILASGLNSGMTPKSKPWVKFTLQNEAHLEIPGAKEWLDFLQKQFNAVLNQSNIYSVFQSAYEELGSFGTACYIILQDYDDVIRARSFTAGEYAIGRNAKGRVNAFARQFWMTVGQMVEEFGFEKCSPQVQNKFKQKSVDESVNIYHLIEENKSRIEGILDSRNMKYASCYWEATETGEKYLKESGFRVFPVVAPMWDAATTDVDYGFGPGWDALGYIKELQKTRFDKLLAQEKLHNPPMQKHSSVENESFLPGGISVTSDSVVDSGVKPAYQINPELESFIQLINEERESIDKFYYVNLFMMIAQLEDNVRTATEIQERQQEKMMMMGPILHRLDEQMLTPTIEIIVDNMNELGMIPPPPEGVEGILEIEYVAVLAQAQKAAGSSQIQKVIEYILLTMQVNPDSLDVYDFDESLREFGENEGIPSKLLKDKQVVDTIRAQRQKMQQAQMAAEMANSAADTTKKLSESQMGQGSALDGLVAPLQQR